VRPHCEDDNVGAWNINVSSVAEEIAEWWILSNDEQNYKKVSNHHIAHNERRYENR